MNSIFVDKSSQIEVKRNWSTVAIKESTGSGSSLSVVRKYPDLSLNNSIRNL